MASGVELATAYVSLVVEGSKVAPGVKKSLGVVEGEAAKTGTRSGKALGSGMSKSFSGHAKNIAAGLGVAFGISKGIGFLKDSNAEAREAQKVGAQTNAVLKSTGGVANVTARGIGNLATAISKKAGIDDEAIQSAGNMLLTFTGVRNELGKGNKVFDQTVQAATDMSVVMKTDATASAMQLGKALNDPIKGVTKLQKQGVTFTDQQKKQIKTLVESGKTLQAQKIILKEVNKEFGGSAAAQATAGDKAAVAWGNLKEQIGTQLLPVVDKFSTLLSTKVVPAASKFISQMQSGSGAGGQFADKLKSLWDTGSRLVGVFTSLPGPVKKFGLEALVAYAAISKLQSLTGGARLSGFISELRNSETRLDAVGKASRRLGEGLKTAAGAGGILAISAGMRQTNKDTGTLLTTLGGAASGFAVAGPLGAAVGGLGGLFFGLSRKAAAAGDAAKGSISDWASLKSTLDGVTGATTAATRAMVLSDLTKSKAIQTTRQLGFSDRDVVDAVVKGGRARGALVNTIDQQVAATKGLIAQQERQSKGARGGAAALAIAKTNELKARLASLQGLRRDIGASDKAVAAKKREIAATRTFTKAVHTLPPQVVTSLRAKVLGKRDLVDLVARYHLLPKKVATLISENGGKPTKARVEAVIAAAKALNRQKAEAKLTARNNASGTIDQVRRDMNNLDGKTATTYIDTVRRQRNEAAKSVGGHRKRAGGGNVLAGQTYIVNELRQEAFVPQVNGRIIANPSAGSGSSVGRLTITNWHDGTGHFEVIADSRIDSAASLNAESVRAI